MRSSMLKVTALVGLIAALSCPAFARADIISNLIRYWKFDETVAGPVVDATGNSDGTNYGATIDQPGERDRAYLFDGVDDYVDTNSVAIPATGDFSLFAWVKTSQTESQGSIFSVNAGQSGRANLAIDNGKLAWFHKGGVGFVQSSMDINDDVWHLVGITRLSDTFTFWVDEGSELVGTSYAAIAVDENLVLGSKASHDGLWFDGLIDDARVYGRALSADDVSELIPEPGTLALLATGLIGLLCYAWRKRK